MMLRTPTGRIGHGTIEREVEGLLDLRLCLYRCGGFLPLNVLPMVWISLKIEEETFGQVLRRGRETRAEHASFVSKAPEDGQKTCAEHCRTRVG